MVLDIEDFPKEERKYMVGIQLVRQITGPVLIMCLIVYLLMKFLTEYQAMADWFALVAAGSIVLNLVVHLMMKWRIKVMISRAGEYSDTLD